MEKDKSSTEKRKQILPNFILSHIYILSEFNVVTVKMSQNKSRFFMLGLLYNTKVTLAPAHKKDYVIKKGNRKLWLLLA